jgi:hypothetical protein
LWPPSPPEDVFGMPMPTHGQSNWRVMGNTTTEGEWNQLSASKRKDRSNREGMERYEAARRASNNAEQSCISPRFTEERYLQQRPTPVNPSLVFTHEDCYLSQQSRNPTGPTTLTYGPDTGYGQRTSPPATQTRPNLNCTRRRCNLLYTPPPPQPLTGANLR